MTINLHQITTIKVSSQSESAVFPSTLQSRSWLRSMGWRWTGVNSWQTDVANRVIWTISCLQQFSSHDCIFFCSTVNTSISNYSFLNISKLKCRPHEHASCSPSAKVSCWCCVIRRPAPRITWTDAPRQPEGTYKSNQKCISTSLKMPRQLWPIPIFK